MRKDCVYSREVHPSNRRRFVMRLRFGHRDQAVILTLLDTGLRAMELCKLLIGNIDLKTGRVRVFAERTGEATLTCHVWNDGPGFDPADAERLFRKFSRLRDDRSDTRAGTGLGLFVSRQIVERHGGRIWAESEEGHWARFSFTLPTAPGPERAPVPG